MRLQTFHIRNNSCRNELVVHAGNVSEQRLHSRAVAPHDQPMGSSSDGNRDKHPGESVGSKSRRKRDGLSQKTISDPLYHLERNTRCKLGLSTDVLTLHPKNTRISDWQDPTSVAYRYNDTSASLTKNFPLHSHASFSIQRMPYIASSDQ